MQYSVAVTMLQLCHYYIGWVAEFNFQVSLFNEICTALYSITMSVRTEKTNKALQGQVFLFRDERI